MASIRNAENYDESHAAVDRILRSTIANEAVVSLTVACRLKNTADYIVDFQPNDVLQGDWSLLVVTSAHSAIMLEMTGHPPNRHEPKGVPATLKISATHPAHCVLYSSFYSLIDVLIARAYRVKDFMNFLQEDGLLQYRVGSDTHPGHWHFEVIYRLALNGIIEGSSSLRIARKVEEFNKILADCTRRGEAPPRVDADVMLKRGEFVPRIRGESETSSHDSI